MEMYDSADLHQLLAPRVVANAIMGQLADREEVRLHRGEVVMHIHLTCLQWLSW